MRLFVAGLPYDMDSQDLKEMFELYGTVVMAKVVTDMATRKSKGFGFVEFANSNEAKEAMELLNGKQIERNADYTIEANDIVEGNNVLMLIPGGEAEGPTGHNPPPPKKPTGK